MRLKILTKKISKVIKSDKRGLKVRVKPTETTVIIRLNGKIVNPRDYGLKKKSFSHTDFNRIFEQMQKVKAIIESHETEKLEEKIKSNGGFLLNGEYDPKSVPLIPQSTMSELNNFTQFLELLKGEYKK